MNNDMDRRAEVNTGSKKLEEC